MIHTPGPWECETDFVSGVFWVMTVSDGTKDTTIPIAEVYGQDEDSRQVNCEANARLIAAAPDLLEALKDAPLPPMILNYHSQDRIDDWFTDYKIWRNKAIAQVEGKE